MKRIEANLLRVSVLLLMLSVLLQVGPIGLAAEGEGPLEEALTHVREGNYSLADEKCREAIAADPDTECYARIMLAECYASQGSLQDALREAARALEKAGEDPVDAEGAVAAERAMDRFRRAQGRLNQVDALLDNAIVVNASQEEVAWARVRVAEEFVRVGGDATAIRHYGALVEARPQDAELMGRCVGGLTTLWVRLKGHDGARRRLHRIAADHPRTAAAAFAVSRVAGIEESQGRRESAVSLYKAVADEFPGSLAARDALEGLLGIYDRTGESHEALSVAERIPREYPESDSALRAVWTLGRIWESTGSVDEAFATFAPLAREHPGSRLAKHCLENLCRVSALRGRVKEALLTVEDLASEYPDADWRSSGVAQFYSREGEKLARKGDLRAAIGCWEKTARYEASDMWHAEAITRIAVSWGALKEYEKAREAMERVLASDLYAFRERHLVALEYIASTHCQQGQGEEALEVLGRALQLAEREGKLARQEAIRADIRRVEEKLSANTD